MKKIIFLFFIAIIPFLSFSQAQDVIVRTNGDQIKCHILKEDSVNIYFTVKKNGNEINSFLRKSDIMSYRYGNGQNNEINPGYVESYDHLEAGYEESGSDLFLGLGTGLNNYTGFFGAGLEARIVEGLSVFGTGGLGFWGYKIGGGLQYTMKYPYGIAYSVGYSRATGGKGIETEMEVESSSEPKKVVMDYLPASTINLAVGYYWRLGQKSKFGLKGGYAIALEDKPYKLVTPNEELTELSEAVLSLIQPGGLLFGLEFMFGL